MSFDLKSKKTYRDKREEVGEYCEEEKDQGAVEDEILMAWRGKEHEEFNVRPRVFLIITIILIAIIAYAIYENSPIMAITFILIGLVGYIHLKREPDTVNFSITAEGIAVDGHFYEFENIKSFWIFYDPPYEKILSLRMSGRMVPYVHVPIHDQDPVKIREMLTRFVPEIKQQKTLLDTVDSFLH